MSTLLEQWRATAYNEKADRGQLQKFWASYFQIEKEIYEKLLSNPDEEVHGTVKELAERFGHSVMTMVGFLDGIDESLKVVAGNAAVEHAHNQVDQCSNHTNH